MKCIHGILLLSSFCALQARFGADKEGWAPRCLPSTSSTAVTQQQTSDSGIVSKLLRFFGAGNTESTVSEVQKAQLRSMATAYTFAFSKERK